MADWATVAVTLLASIAAFRTLGMLKGQTNAALALLTTERATVRAYLSLSPGPPGLRYDLDFKANVGGVDACIAEAAVGVQNFGNTPAQATYALMQLRLTDQPLPRHPEYDSRELTAFRVSIVKSELLHLRRVFYPASSEMLNVVNRPNSWKAYLIGYVDYIDAFGVRHRSGFARVYNPMLDDRSEYHPQPNDLHSDAYMQRMNLGFVKQPNYNYDRVRSLGEGDDWND